MHKIGTKWVNSHLFGTMLVFIGNEFKKKNKSIVTSHGVIEL